MAKAYWVTTYKSISKPEQLAAYSKLAGPAIQAAGGKFLVRGTAVEAWEAGVKQRTVVIEFPSLKQAMDAHGTPAYQEALRALGNDACVRDMRVVEGAE